MFTLHKTILTSALLTIFLLVETFSQELENNIQQLTLDDVIRLAVDSSLNAFIDENIYMTDYWAFRNYKAQKLPFMDLSATPLDFRRTLSQQYNFQDSSYHYIDQQTINSTANLSINQNITATGGRLYMDSDIGRLDNLNSSNPVQYSATAVRIGFQQDLFGFNPYKWESKIEPLKFEKAKKEFIASMEDIALTAVEYFFDLAKAQINLEIAINTMANADTLYSIGAKRFDIGSVSLEDLYTLKLDLINSKNTYNQSLTSLKRAKMRLNSLLRLNNEEDIILILPDKTPGLKINTMEGLNIAKEFNPEILGFKQQMLESRRNVERTKKDSRVNANIDASFGLYQTGDNLSSAYNDPLDQEIVKLSLNIPIVDWGLAKGKYNMAQRNMDMVEARLRQSEIDFDQNVILTIEEFNLQESLINGSAEADTVSQFAYNIAKKRFLLGNIDLTKLNAIQKSSIAARRQYISSLEQYWHYYYTIRKLTLFDFVNKRPLTRNFDKMIDRRMISK